MELLMKLKEIARLKELSDDLEEQGRETESDSAYAEMWRLAQEAADNLVEMVGGQIDRHTALRMVIFQRRSIIGVITRAAA